MEEINLQKLKILPYARKSKVDKEDKKILSIEGQTKEITRYGQTHGLKLFPIIEENASAYSIGREGFEKVKQIIEAEKADALFAYNATRLARNAIDGGWIIYQLSIGKLKAIITPDKVYYNNGDDKFMLHIHFAMAEKQSDDTSSYVKRDIQGKLDRKEYPHGVCAPYLNIDKEGRIAGKSFDPVKMQMLFDLQRPLKRSELDPIESPKWKQLGMDIIKLHLTLLGAQKRAAELGIKGQYTGKPVSRSVIKYTFNNPFLYGVMRTIRGEFEGDHEPLFTKKEWIEINKVLGDSHKPKYKKDPKWYNKYNALCTCGECQRQISTEPPKRGHLVYLRCTKTRKDYKCKQPYLELSEFEKQIEEKLSKLSIDDRFIEWGIKQINKTNDNELADIESKRRNLQSQINALGIEQNMLLKKWMSPVNVNGDLLSDQEYLQEKNRINADINSLKDKLESTDQDKTNWVHDVERFFLYCRDARQVFLDKDDLGDRKIMLQQIASNISIKDKKVDITFKTPFALVEEMKNLMEEENARFEHEFAYADKQNYSFEGKMLKVLETLIEVRTAQKQFKETDWIIYSGSSGSKPFQAAQ